MTATPTLLGGRAPAIALVLGLFVEAVGYGMVAPTLPFMARQVGADEGRIGLLVGLYAAVGLFVAVPLGALANRFGRRVLILVGLALLTVASVAFVFAPTYGWLLAVRIGFGCVSPGASASAFGLAATETESGRRGAAMGAVFSARSFALSAGAFLGGALTTALGIRGLFAAAGGIVLLGLVVGRQAAD